MKKIFKHFRKNWIRYGFETVVVTIGILIAFGLNNWNENRKTRIKERVLLIELKNNLETNIDNLKSDIEIQIQGAGYIDFLIDHMDNNRPYNDSLSVLFEIVDHAPDIEFALSAFETLKSLGMDVVSSDTLRQAVIKLFGNTYPYLILGTIRLEDQFWPSNVLPLYQKHFRRGDGKAVPQNYELLLADKEFINMLSQRGSLRKGSTILKKAALQNTQDVIDLIEIELSKK